MWYKVWLLTRDEIYHVSRRPKFLTPVYSVVVVMTEPVLAIDEYGRPFIILKDQSTKTRLQGSEAIKVKICQCKCLYIDS